MAVTSNVARNLSVAAPEIAGGMVGVGAPIALREFVDVQQGPLVTGQGSMVERITMPSVVWGVGAGTVTGLLWWMDVGPDFLQDLYLAHTITGIPTGIASAALPKEASGGGGAAASRSTVRRSSSGRTAARATDGGSDFDDSGGSSSEFEPAE